MVESVTAEKSLATDNAFLPLIDLETQTSQHVEPVVPIPTADASMKRQISSNNKRAESTYQSSRTEHQKDLSFKEILLHEDVDCNCEGLINKSLFLFQEKTEASSSEYAAADHNGRGEVGAATGGLFTTSSLWST